ncbi:MAG: hypothetical protein QM640_07260 [Niabella sp.]
MPTAQELFNDYLKSVENLKTIDNFYDYEEAFANLHTELGRQMLAKSLEQPTAKQEYKKNANPLRSGENGQQP